MLPSVTNVPSYTITGYHEHYLQKLSIQVWQSLFILGWPFTLKNSPVFEPTSSYFVEGGQLGQPVFWRSIFLLPHQKFGQHFRSLGSKKLLPAKKGFWACVCVCVRVGVREYLCVCETEREKVCVYVCVCKRERERDDHFCPCLTFFLHPLELWSVFNWRKSEVTSNRRDKKPPNPSPLKKAWEPFLSYILLFDFGSLIEPWVTGLHKLIGSSTGPRQTLLNFDLQETITAKKFLFNCDRSEFKRLCLINP